MDSLLKEFRSWKKENSHFYSELKEHKSVLYDRFVPVYEVLNFLESEITEMRLKPDDDLDKIFSVGYEYLNDQFQTCMMYLETYFKQDLHAFMHYDLVVNALLYLEDVRYELSEQNLNPNNEEIDMLVEELESMLAEKKPVLDTFNLYVDDVLQKTIGEEKFQFVGIIDIFVNVAETLGLYLDDDEEILIGKELEGEGQ